MINVEDAIWLQIKLMRYCLSLAKNRWDAEDLAQEAWSKAMRKLQTTEHANPNALLMRIARNTWIDHTRKLKFSRSYVENEKTRLRLVPANEPGSEHLESIFQSLITRLTPLQRAVFLLKDVYDYSIDETANLLHTSQGAVKSALHRSRKSLEGVKRDLEHHALRLPEEESELTLLRCLAAAFLAGDALRVVELSMHNGMEPSAAAAIAYLHIQKSMNVEDKEISNRTPLRMAA